MVYLKRNLEGDSQHQAQWGHPFLLYPQAHPVPQSHDFHKVDKAASFTSSPDNIQNMGQQGPHIKGFLFCRFFFSSGRRHFPRSPQQASPFYQSCPHLYQSWVKQGMFTKTGFDSWGTEFIAHPSPQLISKNQVLLTRRQKRVTLEWQPAVSESVTSFLQRGNNSTCFTGLVRGWNKITKLDHLVIVSAQ